VHCAERAAESQESAVVVDYVFQSAQRMKRCAEVPPMKAPRPSAIRRSLVRRGVCSGLRAEVG